MVLIPLITGVLLVKRKKGDETMKKKKDLFDLTMDNVTLSSGVLVGTGMVGQLGTMIPSTSSDKIIKGMEPLSMLPTLHSTGIVLGELKKLNKKKW